MFALCVYLFHGSILRLRVLNHVLTLTLKYAQLEVEVMIGLPVITFLIVKTSSVNFREEAIVIVLAVKVKL